jgi:eukaryotic-like serine/threonine-protein kinase
MSVDTMVGRTVAGYRLVRHVGEGGTADVYQAEHVERGAAAVKILRPRLARDSVAVQRFFREAEYGARVSHPNIVRTYDYGEAEGLHYLALEWAEGEPLAEFATRSGRVPLPLVAIIVEQIGGGLAAAHRAGIIHRDLKPANVMYNAAGRRAKLLDFGIARDADLDPEQRLTRTGFFVGTLQYVAPETLSGELVSEQADVYSLATITYYLLTATHPYIGRNPRELFQQLLTQPAVSLNQAQRGLRFPAIIEAAVMQGLERDRAVRCKTVDEFVQQFCSAVQQTAEGKRSGFLASLFRKGAE